MPSVSRDYVLKWDQEGEDLLINIRLHSGNQLIPLLKAQLPSSSKLIEPPPVVNGIFVRNGARFEKIRFEEILYLEACGAYTQIYVQNKSYTLSRNLARICEGLSYPFMRVHRSYTINLENINSFSEKIVYFPGKLIPVSEQYRKELLSHFNCL